MWSTAAGDQRFEARRASDFEPRPSFSSGTSGSRSISRRNASPCAMRRKRSSGDGPGGDFEGNLGAVLAGRPTLRNRRYICFRRNRSVGEFRTR